MSNTPEGDAEQRRPVGGRGTAVVTDPPPSLPAAADPTTTVSTPAPSAERSAPGHRPQLLPPEQEKARLPAWWDGSQD